MSNKHRCDECNHLPGPRALDYCKKQGTMPRRQHKKPCDCECHAYKGEAK